MINVSPILFLFFILNFIYTDEALVHSILYGRPSVPYTDKDNRLLCRISICKHEHSYSLRINSLNRTLTYIHVEPGTLYEPITFIFHVASFASSTRHGLGYDYTIGLVLLNRFHSRLLRMT